MARPLKSLRARVRDGSFLARKHETLLLGERLEWPRFAALQDHYARATSEPEARAVALEFERLVNTAHQETRKRNGSSSDRAEMLRTELAARGTHGSAGQLIKFFPYYLAHTTGPMVGQPFPARKETTTTATGAMVPAAACASVLSPGRTPARAKKWHVSRTTHPPDGRAGKSWAKVFRSFSREKRKGPH